ncbi:MAG: archaetidylserine decarboxylase [Myxococcota bacterium]
MVPRRWASSALGRLARRPSRWLTQAFVWAYEVDLSEAQATEFDSLDALFVRRLRAGTRPIDADPHAMVSPVDGTVAFCGPTDGRIPLGPVPFSLADVSNAAPRVSAAIVLYLSPRDYHRVHAPLDGRVQAYRYLPGSRWPVFLAAVRRIPRLFARNERLVFEVDTDRGPMLVALVGAFGVGRIESPLLDEPPSQARSGDLDARVAKGEEMGVFHLGSTVILGLPSVPTEWKVRVGAPVRMGQAIARFG